VKTQSLNQSAQATVSNPLDISNWDSIAASFPQYTFFHSSTWLRVLAESYGYRPICLSVGDSDRPDAVAVAMEIDSWLTGKRGICLPFTDVCPPLHRSDGALKSLLGELVAFARKQKWKRLECRAPDGFDPETKASTEFYVHVLELEPTTDSQFARFSASNRRALRKAQASDLQVNRFTDLDSLRAFYHLLCKTRQRHGVPPQPWSFFESIHRHIISKDQGSLFLAYHDQQPIAGALYLRDREKAIYKFGASDHQYQSLRPNNLVMWQAIQWLIENDCQSLDFGRTSLDNEGLRRFKQSWGTTETILPYYSLDPTSETILEQPDQSSGWHNQVFRRMPKSISRLAGQLLYKHIG